MEFSPSNPVVKLCLQGMQMEDNNKPGDAATVFQQAWNTATNDFEKFIAAWYVARHQATTSDELQWYETALQLATKIDDDTVHAAFPVLHIHIAKCHENIGDAVKAKRHQELADPQPPKPSDKGPFYHGTKAHLKVGDLLVAGHASNYKSDLQMNHIYFTALPGGAGLAASLAKGDGAEHVYMVEPTGDFEDDPNVTNKKFPGNPTRSYRTEHPLKIVADIKDWTKQTPGELKKWRDRLENHTGEIIN